MHQLASPRSWLYFNKAVKNRGIEGLPFSNTWGYAWAYRAARSPTGLLTTAEASGVPFLPHGPQDLAKDCSLISRESGTVFAVTKSAQRRD